MERTKRRRGKGKVRITRTARHQRMKRKPNTSF